MQYLIKIKNIIKTKYFLQLGKNIKLKKYFINKKYTFLSGEKTNFVQNSSSAFKPLLKIPSIHKRIYILK